VNQSAAVPISVKWDDIADNDRAVVLTNMRKGWVDMPETIRPC